MPHIGDATEISFTDGPGVYAGFSKGIALLWHAPVRIGPHGTGGVECHENDGFGDLAFPFLTYGGRWAGIGRLFRAGGVTEGDLIKSGANFMAWVAYDGRAGSRREPLDPVLACLAFGTRNGLPVRTIGRTDGQVHPVAVCGGKVWRAFIG